MFRRSTYIFGCALWHYKINLSFRHVTEYSLISPTPCHAIHPSMNPQENNHCSFGAASFSRPPLVVVVVVIINCNLEFITPKHVIQQQPTATRFLATLFGK